MVFLMGDKETDKISDARRNGMLQMFEEEDLCFTTLYGDSTYESCSAGYAARTSGAMGGAKEAIASIPLPYTLGEEIIESMDRITASYTRVFQASANK